MTPEEVRQLRILAQALLDNSGCNDPDCCEAAFSEAKAREELRIHLERTT